jgi:hypothetical protein
LASECRVSARSVVPATRSQHPVGIDLVGTVLFAATLVALLVPLTEGNDVGWAAWTWVLLAVSALLAVVTFVLERRSELRGEVPLLPPSLLRLPSMWRGLALILPFSMGFGSFMFVFALVVLGTRMLPKLTTAVAGGAQAEVVLDV